MAISGARVSCRRIQFNPNNIVKRKGKIQKQQNEIKPILEEAQFFYVLFYRCLLHAEGRRQS